MDLQKCVHDALDNAVVNGYDPYHKPVAEVTLHLMRVSSYCKDMDPKVVERYVLTWLHGPDDLP